MTAANPPAGAWDRLPLLRNLSGEVEVSPAEWEADEKTLRALQERTQKLLDGRTAPWPPSDPERLALGIAQAERGEVVSADEFLVRPDIP